MFQNMHADQVICDENVVKDQSCLPCTDCNLLQVAVISL